MAKPRGKAAARSAGKAPARKAAPKKAAPAKKPTAKQAPAKRVPAKRGAAKAPAKRGAAKAPAAKNASKAPANKAPASKAPANRALGHKAPATRVAAKAPADKAPTKPVATTKAPAKPVTTGRATPVGAKAPAKNASAGRGAARAPATRDAAMAASKAHAPMAVGTAPARSAAPDTPAAFPPVPPVETRGGDVVRMLEAEDPIGALRAFLDGIHGGATVQQGQIALGSAQLMLLPIAREHRGGAEVKELLDLVLGRWTTFPDRTGFHAQEFLRNAFAAVGDDRERIARLAALVPADASAELRFNVASALAVAGDRDGMLRAIEAALLAGASASSFGTDDDFAAYRDDPGFEAVLARAAAPSIPIDIGPHLPIVRSSLDSAVRTLREFGEVAKLEPPASLEAVLTAERLGKVQLPNDYRALLTLSDGLTLWDHTFFGTVDYRNETDLAKSAARYLEISAGYGRTGIADCVPLANWGQPNDWLLYDPLGRVRGGAPGYVLMLNADECPLDGLAHALDRFERIARDVLGTN